MEGYSIDAQKEFLLNYAKAKEFDAYEYYVDGGYSGKNLERPAIKQLIEDVKNHLLDCVIVFKLDRISRSQKDTLYLIEEVFNKYKVGFISIRENFDTTTPFGKAMIGVLSIFAQLERETILERTKIGIQKRAENGFWRGGGKVPFPYMYDKKLGVLIPNPKQVEILHKMISMYISGYSFIKIGNIVGMDESLVEKRILSRTNLGIIPYKGKEFKGKHKAVVSKKIYDRIIEINKLRSKSRTESHYLLSGKIYCGHCGAKYRYQKWGKRLICYCYSQQKSKPKYVKNPNCQNKKWDSYEIETNVLKSIFLLNFDKSLFDDNFNILEVNIINEYKNRIEKINSQIDNLINFLSNNILVEKIKEKIIKLEQEKEVINKNLNIIINNKEKDRASSSFSNGLEVIWEKISFEEKRMVIMQLIDKIVVTDNNVEIFYRVS